MENTEKMTERRAQEIALAIIKYEAKRRELTLDPHHDLWTKKCREMEIDPPKMHQFIVEIWLPLVVKQSMGMTLNVKVKEVPPLHPSEQQAIAMKLVRSRGVDLGPDFKRRAKRIEKDSGVEAEEIEEFYMTYIIPHQLAILKGSNRHPIAPAYPRR